MLRRRGWGRAVSAALIAVSIAAATPAAGAVRDERPHQAARLSLPRVWELLSSWLGILTIKACTTSEGSPMVDPNGCPSSSQSAEPAAEGGPMVDPDG